MPIYELVCDEGHPSETLRAFGAPLPDCPECGAATHKRPSSFGVGGAASLPPAPAAMPQTWRGTHNADREYVTSLRRTAEARQKLEAKHPELAGDRRPVIAHEGPFEKAPLRAGDPVPKAHGHPHGGES
jgi:putative FmdB family regulatory protein